MTFKEKIDDPLIAIMLSIFAFVVFGILLLKVLGGTSLPSEVERDGFCKEVYGKDFDYKDGSREICKSFKGNLTHKFTEQEFREVCPKNKFLSTKFYSDCFHKGEPISE